MNAYAASWLALGRPLLLIAVSLQLLAISFSCTRATWHAPLALPDTATMQLAPGVALGKIKARTVIVQAGQGNTATTTDKVRADAVASGAGSTVSATTKTGASWWLLLLLGAAGWEWASSYLPRLWLPWRVRPG